MSNKTKKAKELIENDPDYIYSPANNFSLEEFTKKHDEGVDDGHISKVLLISEEEVDTLYQSAVEKIKNALGVESE